MSEIIGGINPVSEALKARPEFFEKIFVRKERHGHTLKRLISQARALKVKVDQVDRDRLDQMYGGKGHQGVVAKVGEYNYHSLEDVLDSKHEHPPLILVLDSVSDPMNLGSLIRSAESAGAKAVVIPRDRAAPVTRVVIKASAGAAEHIPVVRVVNLVRSIETLKEAGFWVVGADNKKGKNLYQAKLEAPLALVIGGEDQGLRRLVSESCDEIVNIPQRGKVSSLNTAVAGALLMFEFVRQTESS